jgi:nonsense-mediated mRNA decay protein 3
MGYLLTGSNFNNADFEAMESSGTYSSTIPDVILVKKYYPRKKKNKARNWRLKRINMEDEDAAASGRKQDRDRLEQDFGAHWRFTRRNRLSERRNIPTRWSLKRRPTTRTMEAFRGLIWKNYWMTLRNCTWKGRPTC